MKYYIIAGEASGDLHGSNLMREIKKQDSNAEFRFWGGDLMQEHGGEMVKHYRDLAFMGFVEVAMNLRTILGNLKFCKQDIEAYQPDALILIDYPGFNLRVAEWAHEKGIPVHYYISPQIWAWKQSRVHKIKKVVDFMYVILPFEEEFYARFDYPVEYVGHPLLDAIEQFKAQDEGLSTFLEDNNLNPEKPIIAILPGSRKQEISIKLPIMLSVRKHYPDYQFVVAGAPSQDASFYESFISKYNDVHLINNQTYRLLHHAKAALVTSGTATLETALFQVPEVVCYKGSWISYVIARNLIKVNYISLVNLIMDRELVKELIQGELNTKNIKHELDLILNDPKKQADLKSGYQELADKLGGGGASKQAATSLLKNLGKHS